MRKADEEKLCRDLMNIHNEVEHLLSDRDLFKKADDNVKGCINIISNSKSENYRTLLSRRLKDMEIGTITLTADDYFQLWTDMHIKDEIVFLKVTSRIHPSYWKEPEMQLYQKRQIETINRFSNYDGNTRESLSQIVYDHVGDILESLKKQYKREEISERAISTRFENKIERIFERIFIIDPAMVRNENDVNDLVKILKSQVDGGIAIRVICIKMNEVSTFDRPQDFGLVLTRTGDLFVMYCDVDIAGRPQGGIIIVDRNKIVHYFDCYLKIRGVSQEILQDSSEKEIEDIIHKLAQSPIDISDSSIYGNRCYMCLKKQKKLF